VIARLTTPVAVLTVAAVLACCAQPQPARANAICSVAGLINGAAGKICTAAGKGKTILAAGKKLLGGHLGGAVKTLTGSTAGKAITITAALAGVVTWVYAGARFALKETASVISTTTKPQLGSTWFSSFYWRMAGVSALLTLPFLFAAAIQALVRSDLAMLARSVFGYLPLGLIGVGIAAPLTTLLLAGSDELSHIVSGAAGNADGQFLVKVSVGAGALSLVSHSPFIAFFVGLLAAAAAIVLWCELLIRAAAVYVIVLMLPLFFAALVWPARRVWAVRAVELLVALILSKFAIVAVLALGGAAIGHTAIPSVTQMLAGATLVLLAAFSPWALLRLLPLHELAAGAAGGLRTQSQGTLSVEPAEAATAVAREHAIRMLPQGEAEAAPAEPAARAAVSRLDGAQGRDRNGGTPGGSAEAEEVDGAGSATGPDEAPGGETGSADGSTGQTTAASAEHQAAAASAEQSPGHAAAASAERPPAQGAASENPPPDQASAATAASAPEDQPPPRGELPSMFRADNFALRTLHLGENGDWRPLDEPGGAPGDRHDPPEDHAPLPPAQEPDDGNL
jgi:hypothetical protein